MRPDSPARQATTVHGLVAEQAALTPDAVAVSHGDTQLTYADLETAANTLAHHLVSRGVRPGDVVALLMDRSAEFVVAALAVLAAGGAYLPLDRRQPPDRLGWMVRDAGAALVLTDGPAQNADFAAGIPVEETPPAGAARDGMSAPPDVLSHPEQLAYVMYTSGSTGRPKGVANTHRNIVDFVLDPCWDSARQERVLAYSPLGFDSSTYELWVPLTRGGSAVVWAVDPFDVGELREVIARHEVTAMYLTTALFDTVANEDVGALAPLHEIITGGDVLSTAALRQVRAHCPDTTVVHAYGPTETTVFCSLQVFGPTRHDEPGHDELQLHLGQPMAGTAMYVLDEDLRHSPQDAVGELCVAGSHLARGYLGQPGLTAQRFVPDPYGPRGSRMYRTGDLARRRGDDTITFMGRADRQVKIRGFRIEPAEVEAVLVHDPEVSQAAVTVREDLPGGRGLVAYLVPATPGKDLDVEGVRHRAAATLPGYLVPSAFVVLPGLPLTAHGKVDRGALPRPPLPADGDMGGHAGAEGVRTPLEETLSGLFAEVLQCPPVGAEDNFFQLGGHSLLAIRLGARIRATTQRAVTIRDVFRNPTVAQLAAHLSADTDATKER